ncbi:MAG TPA: AAA family ATPase [Streptosporangiaceae bacterium]|nr:AAA family ATPase [Streptosporangiaceae bacterium]
MRARSAAFAGRRDTLSDLRRILSAARGGTGQCVVIEGPTGIGKSRLLQVMAAEARTLGMTAATGRATELDRVAPLSTLLSALRRGGLDGVDSTTLGGQGNDRFWLVDRMRELIESHVRTRPLLIALDDVQWADELTMLALRIMVPELAGEPVCWLFARRTRTSLSTADTTIDWLVMEGATRIELGPLPDSAVAELCADLLGMEPDAAALALAARGSGNPFLLQQLFTTLRDSGQLAVVSGSDTGRPGDLPSCFMDTVNLLLQDLSTGAHSLLEAGAVLNRPFTLHEAAGLLSRNPVGLLPIAKEAVQAGILTADGPELWFNHDLIRESVYGNLYEPIRIALHREAAELVKAEGRSPTEIAEHLIRGGGRDSDGQAALVLRDAVTQLAPSAPGTAADLILRMLDMLDEQDPARASLTAEAVRLLASVGRVTEARELGESALLGGLDPTTEAKLLLGLAESFKHAGQNAAVVEATGRALANGGVPDSVRAQLLAIRAHGLIYVGDITGADRAGDEAAILAEATGEHSAMVFGNVARSVAARERGDLDASIKWAQSAVQRADQAGGEARHRHPRLWLARALVTADRFDEADTIYGMGQRETARLGTAWSEPLWHFYRAELRSAQGLLTEAAAEAEHGLRVAEKLNTLQLSLPSLALLTQIAVHRGDLTAASRYLGRLERLTQEGVCAGPLALLWPLALYQDAIGESRAALETISPLVDALPKRPIFGEAPMVGPTLLKIAQRAGSKVSMGAVVSALQRMSDLNPTVPSMAGGAHHVLGLHTGDLEAFRSALRHYSASPRPLARAMALEDTALAEHAAGHQLTGAALMEEARSRYALAGARHHVGRVQNSLRAFGIRRKPDPEPQGPPESATATPLTLTQSELRVAQLVTEGLTNRAVAKQLFLSPHTVDSHLRHVFAKLGVNSRVELTRCFMARAQELEGTALAASASRRPA